MRRIADTFHDNMNLEQLESLKIFLFIMKAVSGITYVFVLGYLAAGGVVDAGVGMFLAVGAAFDLVPELLTLRVMSHLPPRAQRAESVQLVLAVTAYLLLIVTLFIAAPFGVFNGYAMFALLWIVSFMVQNATFFLLGEDELQETIHH